MSSSQQRLILLIICVMAHGWAMFSQNIPSQDGLKFIELARRFEQEPAWDVIRSADQHPLYPMLVSKVHQQMGWLSLTAATSWRIAAQLVSFLAAIATIFPIFRISQRLFHPASANLAVFFWLVLPVPMSIGHETLSDALALAFGLWALELGLMTSESSGYARKWLLAGGVGFCVSLAYWTRPEGIVIGLTILIFWILSACLGTAKTSLLSAKDLISMATFLIICLFSVGLYQTINGSISDRLSKFSEPSNSASIASSNLHANMPRGLPLTLRDRALDFSPKDPLREVRHPGLKAAVWQIVREWSESLCMVLGVMTLWGMVRVRCTDRNALLLTRIYGFLVLAMLLYQASRRGYLSERHVINLTWISLPFAAAAVSLCVNRLADIGKVTERRRLVVSRIGLAGILLLGIWQQSKPAHQSRLPHIMAGQWLKQNAAQGTAVFDTRGWASFESNLRRYDPYHIPQALSDSSTAFWVVEAGELSSGSARARTLNQLLSEGGQLVNRFAKERHSSGTDEDDVLLFAWKRPVNWDLKNPALAVDTSSTIGPKIDDKILPTMFESRKEPEHR